MLLFLGAVVAGVLTTLAPCVLPMLPVIVGGSLGPSSAQARRRAYVITASLGVSIVVFGLIAVAGDGSYEPITVSGLAQKMVDTVRAPIEARLINQKSYN